PGEPAPRHGFASTTSEPASRKEQGERQAKAGKREKPDNTIHGGKCAPPGPGIKKPLPSLPWHPGTIQWLRNPRAP
ncbi:MAG: hypothetical protein QGI77_09745, partial [Roseibacillus sp.]|nr:hypothetical protein [Roseibacillus sp.]